MASVYDIVLSNIISEMNKDIIPWQKPWIAIEKTNITNVVTDSNNKIIKINQYYSGINRMLLADEPEDFYITFNEINKRKGKLKKGSKSKIVVFWKCITGNDNPSSNDEIIDSNENGNKKQFILRYYRVFKIKDVEGILRPTFGNNNNKEIPDIYHFIESTKANIRIGGSEACYLPSKDEIHIPEIGRFDSSEHYYSTLFHELIHWTSHKDRCNRELGKHFGDEKYSKEELVAEIGSAFLLRYFGVELSKPSAQYIKEWLKALKNDKRMLFQASGLAEKAVEWLLKKN